jgi:adenine phosphoribosyltransferase
MTVKSRIRTVPHYPHQGIMFRDITTLLKDPIGLRATIQEIVARYKDVKIDMVAGIESRGFIVGTPVAYELGLGFVPIRKRGKLPAETVGRDYQLEYGSDRIEIHLDAIQKGDRVLLVDDLIATGGTAEAAVKLIEDMGGIVVECCLRVRGCLLETCKNLLRDPIAALRGTRIPGAAQRQALSTFRFLRSVRLALKPLATIFIRFQLFLKVYVLIRWAQSTL